MAPADVVVRVLDGEDTIGGSKILVGWGGEGVFLDFGINYAKYGRFFEEYVKPRTATGLGDLWKLGLVPRIPDLYRPEVVPSGLRGDARLPVGKVSGVYVSHAHLDHAGLVGLLREDIPLVCSRTTAAILKAVQDTQKADLFAQSVYHSPYRAGTVGGQSVLRSDESEPYHGRDAFLTDGTGSASFGTFWQMLPRPPSSGAPRGGRPRKTLRPGALGIAQPSAGGVHARAALVDHSVLGASGFTLETPQGPIVYSGDLRAHGQHADATRAFLDALVRRPPWILLMEGTQVREREGPDEALGLPTGEDEVERNSLDVVENHRGELVVADFAPRNVERLQAFLRIAQATARRLVILPRDAYLLHAMNAADPSVPVPSDRMLVLDPPAGGESAWERWVLDAYEGHVLHTADVRARQGELVLCLSFWDVKHLLDVQPDRGAYLYSSSEAHSEEQSIDLRRLHHWVEHFGLRLYGFHPVPGTNGAPRMFADRGFHASGHMPGDEVLEWVERIRPEHLLPVHTEGRAFFEKRLAGTGIRLLSGGFG